MVLPPSEVHVWLAPPRLKSTELAWLDRSERGRADSYLYEIDRARFVTGTALVRRLYATELGIRPDEVRLRRRCADCDRPHGKVHPVGDVDVEVSVSHSGDWVMVVACRTYPVGVDVERVDSNLDHLLIADMALSGAERLVLEGMPLKQRAEGFATYWTRKEATLKAVGFGLRTPPSDVEVSGPDQPAQVTAWVGGADMVERLSLYDIDVDSSHRAAVAVVGAPPVRIVTHGV